jgi:hypothetical protein
MAGGCIARGCFRGAALPGDALDAALDAAFLGDDACLEERAFPPKNFLGDDVFLDAFFLDAFFRDAVFGAFFRDVFPLDTAFRDVVLPDDFPPDVFLPDVFLPDDFLLDVLAMAQNVIAGHGPAIETTVIHRWVRTAGGQAVRRATRGKYP